MRSTSLQPFRLWAAVAALLCGAPALAQVGVKVAAPQPDGGVLPPAGPTPVVQSVPFGPQDIVFGPGNDGNLIQRPPDIRNVPPIPMSEPRQPKGAPSDSGDPPRQHEQPDVGSPRAPGQRPGRRSGRGLHGGRRLCRSARDGPQLRQHDQRLLPHQLPGQRQRPACCYAASSRCRRPIPSFTTTSARARCRTPGWSCAPRTACIGTPPTAPSPAVWPPATAGGPRKSGSTPAGTASTARGPTSSRTSAGRTPHPSAPGSDYVNTGNFDADFGIVHGRARRRGAHVGMLTGWYGWAWGLRLRHHPVPHLLQLFLPRREQRLLPLRARRGHDAVLERQLGRLSGQPAPALLNTTCWLQHRRLGGHERLQRLLHRRQREPSGPRRLLDLQPLNARPVLQDVAGLVRLHGRGSRHHARRHVRPRGLPLPPHRQHDDPGLHQHQRAARSSWRPISATPTRATPPSSRTASTCLRTTSSPRVTPCWARSTPSPSTTPRCRT